MAAATVLFGAVLLGTAQTGWAQAPKSGPAGGTPLPRNQAEFEKQLGITAAQKAKMDAVKKKYEPKAKALQAQMQALMTKQQAQMRPLQTQMQTLGTQATKEMQAILTPAQQAKIKAMQAAQAAQRQQGGGGMMGGGPPR